MSDVAVITVTVPQAVETVTVTAPQTGASVLVNAALPALANTKDQQVLFNDGGAIAGNGGFTFNKASGSLTTPGGVAFGTLGNVYPSLAANRGGTNVLDVLSTDQTTWTTLRTGPIVASGSVSIGGFGDVFLYRDAANTLAMRNGVNPQTFRLANSWTDASNNEFGGLRWNANIFQLYSASLGTGSARNIAVTAYGTGTELWLGAAGDHRVKVTGTSLDANYVNTLDFGAGTPFRHGYFAGNLSVSTAGGTTGTAALTVWGSATDNNWAGGIQFKSLNSSVVSAIIASTNGLMLSWGATTLQTLRSSGVVFSPTWASAGTTYTGLTLNVTDTASATVSVLADLQVSGVSKFSVRKDGRVLASILDVYAAAPGNSYIAANINAGGPEFFSGGVSGGAFSPNGLVVPNGKAINWTSVAGGGALGNYDTSLYRDSAGVLTMRNGTAKQGIRLAYTYTDAANNEFLYIGGDATYGFKLEAQFAGTGGREDIALSGRYIRFLSGGTEQLRLQNASLLAEDAGGNPTKVVLGSNAYPFGQVYSVGVQTFYGGWTDSANNYGVQISWLGGGLQFNTFANGTGNGGGQPTAQYNALSHVFGVGTSGKWQIDGSGIRPYGVAGNDNTMDIGTASYRARSGWFGTRINSPAYNAYNFYNSGSDNERFEVRWASNVVYVGTNQIGTGVARYLCLEVGGLAAALWGSSNVQPGAALSNAYDIGGAAVPFRTGYFGTSVVVGSLTVLDNTSTVDLNTVNSKTLTLGGGNPVRLPAASPLIFGNSNAAPTLQAGTASGLELFNSTTPQFFNVYGTKTDASNYERVSVRYSGSYFWLDAQAAGSGTLRGWIHNGAEHIFAIAGTSKWRIDTSGHLHPYENTGNNSAYDFGTSAYRVRNGYFAGLDISNSTADTGVTIGKAAPTYYSTLSIWSNYSTSYPQHKWVQDSNGPSYSYYGNLRFFDSSAAYSGGNYHHADLGFGYFRLYNSDDGAGNYDRVKLQMNGNFAVLATEQGGGGVAR